MRLAAMVYAPPATRDRIGAATAALLVVCSIGIVLILGLSVRIGRAASDALTTFAVTPEAPPPVIPPVPEPKRSVKREGAASPPNLRSKATEIVAPPPVVVVPAPAPVIVAPVAGAGAQRSSGAAEIAGPGTGSGGIGNGTGSGGRGDGDGSGGSETPPRRIGGRIRNSDYPDGAAAVGSGGSVEVRYLVWTDGRVTECEIEHSSGNDELDDATCDLIMKRFRFKPSLDSHGRAIPSQIVETHSWIFEAAPPRRR